MLQENHRPQPASIREQDSPVRPSRSGTKEPNAEGGERYVAKFRNLTFDRASLHANHCYIPVSLGQEYHEGAKFESIVRLVEKSFVECTIIVSDLLHRHTLSIGDPNLSKLQAYEQSIEVGRDWVADNRRAWDGLDIPCHVVYWSELLCAPEYLPNRCALDDLCLRDVYANTLVDEMVGHFVMSACDECTPEVERERIAALSREYLLEEHAIQLRMIPRLCPEHHFVYPHTNRLDPLMLFYERMTGELCRWLRIRISRK